MLRRICIFCLAAFCIVFLAFCRGIFFSDSRGLSLVTTEHASFVRGGVCYGLKTNKCNTITNVCNATPIENSCTAVEVQDPAFPNDPLKKITVMVCVQPFTRTDPFKSWTEHIIAATGKILFVQNEPIPCLVKENCREQYCVPIGVTFRCQTGAAIAWENMQIPESLQGPDCE